MKDYDIFDFNIFGSLGKITITGIGRELKINKIIRSSEHSGFTELSGKENYLSSKNLGLCSKNYQTMPFSVLKKCEINV